MFLRIEACSIIYDDYNACKIFDSDFKEPQVVREHFIWTAIEKFYSERNLDVAYPLAREILNATQTDGMDINTWKSIAREHVKEYDKYSDAVDEYLDKLCLLL